MIGNDSKKFRGLLAAAVGALLLCHGAAHAGAPPTGFARDMWLNPNYAEHGKPLDHIFYFIFWITTIITVIVEVGIVWIAIKYRHSADRKKAVFIHGNTHVEMVWTIIPAIILIAIAVWTKKVWDNYRYSPIANDPNRLQVLVIGEQYKWNVIYPGPHGKIGRYLLYPKTTDLKWPTVPPGKTFNFPNVPGPAYLPEEQAARALNKYIGEINPLGRDYSDPDTDPLLPADRRRLDSLRSRSDLSGDEQKDLEALQKIESLNDYNNANSRNVVIPKGRPVEFIIGSRDVIHDFFLPNFRTKLDVVPGMKGHLYLTATAACKEFEAGPQDYTLDEMETILKQKHDILIPAIINENSPKADHFVKRRPKADYWRYAKDVKDPATGEVSKELILQDGYPITLDAIKDLRQIGLTKIHAAIPFSWDIICEELCGEGHYKMTGKIIVVDDTDLQSPEYKNYFPAKR